MSPYPLSAAEATWLGAQGIAVPEALAGAVEKRRQEFLGGRYCAARALRLAGHTDALVLPIRADHSVEWPAGFVGSIAHAHGLAASAVASSRYYRGLGLDFEPCMEAARAQGVASKIYCGPDEAVGLARALPDWSEAERVTWLFTAKEALYKCLAPICGRFFGFEAAQIVRVLDRGPEAGRFEIELRAELSPEFGAGWRVSGRFERNAGQLASAITLKAGKSGLLPSGNGFV